MQTNATLRHDYTLTEIAALYEQPLMSLIHQAQTIHLAHHEPEAIEKAVLLNIKTGACRHPVVPRTG